MKSIYSFILLMPALILSMTKDGGEKPPLVLNNEGRFTPQVLSYFGVHQSLQQAYKSKINREDLRFLAFRLYNLTVNVETVNNVVIAHKHILEDRIQYFSNGSYKTSLEQIAHFAWKKISPKIFSIADREDWTPEHTHNILNDFWAIYLNLGRGPERTKRREKIELA